MALRTSFSSFALSALCIALYFPSALSQFCYLPDGSLTGDDDFEPCSTNPRTICCATNRPNPPGNDTIYGSTADECLPNGLCANRYQENGVETVSYWRDFCTDKDFASGNCLNVCTDSANTPMTPCDDTETSETWCCGSTRSCCTPDNPKAIRLAAIFGNEVPSASSSAASSTAPSSASSSAASTTSSAGSTTAAPASATSSSAQKQDDGGLSTGAKAGIGVGAVAGALLLLGLGFFVAKALSWKRKASPAAPASVPGENQSYYPPSEVGQYPHQTFPMQQPQPVRYELDPGKPAQPGY